MSSKPYGVPRTDALFHELSVAHYGESALARRERVEHGLLKHAVALEKELVALRNWLDNNTTFYNTDDSDGPVLAGVSARIWYHATDDQLSYPFSTVVKAAS